MSKGNWSCMFFYLNIESSKVWESCLYFSKSIFSRKLLLYKFFCYSMNFSDCWVYGCYSLEDVYSESSESPDGVISACSTWESRCLIFNAGLLSPVFLWGSPSHIFISCVFSYICHGDNFDDLCGMAIPIHFHFAGKWLVMNMDTSLTLLCASKIL